MVCIPCILIPLFLWIYCKFLQPYVIRLVPRRWRASVDAYLYPTCPLKTEKEPATISENDEKLGKDTLVNDTKKDN
uniref:Uncharacterized protein n=1 Tax=Romanomermis culicivorax TaxID=13658 RepID=A0A915KBI8_ROMCU